MGFLSKLLGRPQKVAPTISTNMQARGENIQSAEEKAIVRSHMEEEMASQKARRNAGSDSSNAS